jgi:hypothetical protein
LTITAEQLELRKKVGRFERVKTYDVDAVYAVRAVRVPTDEDEPESDEFCLLVWHGEERLAIGSGMDEREAVFVALTVLARMRALGRWDESSVLPDEPRREERGGLAAGLVAVVVFVGGIGLISTFLGDDVEPPRQTHLGRFSDPADYAAAESLFVLNTEGTKAVGRPSCDGATWTRWSCRVETRVEVGSLTGRTVTYVCAPTASPRSTLCRPDEPGLLQHPIPQVGDGG